MAASPNHNAPDKRKADEIVPDEAEEGEIAVFSEEPTPKKARIDRTETGHWNVDMEMPRGKPRPTFDGEFEEHRVSGSGSVGDPAIMWLGKIPLDVEVSQAFFVATAAKEANEDIVRWTASRLDGITHIYIRCATQSTKFVDRDGKRICIWNPDSIHFYHRTVAADPHISLAMGTNEDNLVLYGYINVDVDKDGKPVDLATYRNPDYVVDGDDRNLQLFPYEEEQHYCIPYCLADHGFLIDTCELARARRCPLHNTEGLLDHFCFRTRWKAETYDDHFCPCQHDLTGLIDHYCPCVHETRRIEKQYSCPHKIPSRAKLLHYCPRYSF
ncbi:hypothetical protein F4776DRAFT_669039 [Hypoxylon sp. NC0597]|nr:hypothetical protein F4776DRAFT_669039 [Hypoxylon sp. NC0597]